MSDKKKIVLTALITAVVTAFISVNLTSFVKDRIAIYLPSKDENKAFSNKMTAVENMLSSNYLYDFDKTKLRDDAIKAYVDGLDEPYTHGLHYKRIAGGTGGAVYALLHSKRVFFIYRQYPRRLCRDRSNSRSE